MEAYALEVHFRYFFNVLTVVFAHHNIGNARTLGSQNFFFDAAHGQHLAAQCYLARHGRVGAHLALC